MTFQREGRMALRTPAEVDAERAEAARREPHFSYADLTAATEQQIAVYQKLAVQEPKQATKAEYYRAAHGALSLWRRLSAVHGQADADRLQALVDAILPSAR